MRSARLAASSRRWKLIQTQSSLGSQNQICGRFDKKILFIKDCSRNDICKLYIILIVLSTPLNPLSNGANNFFMFHQKYFLNRQKQKTRF